MDKLIHFLRDLDDRQIYYRLGRIRDSILVEAAVPGERWEIEFMDDGEIQIERFVSTGEILGKEALAAFFQKFGD